MNILKLIIGLLLVAGCITYAVYEVNRYKKDKKFDYMIFSYDIKVYTGVLIFFTIGIIMICRELKFIL